MKQLEAMYPNYVNCPRDSARRESIASTQEAGTSELYKFSLDVFPIYNSWNSFCYTYSSTTSCNGTACNPEIPSVSFDLALSSPCHGVSSAE
jgi:hypothetical protein